MRRKIILFTVLAFLLPCILSFHTTIAEENQMENEGTEVEIIDTEAVNETIINETDMIETDAAEAETIETNIIQTEAIETEIIETNMIETEILETEMFETEMPETEPLISESEIPESELPPESELTDTVIIDSEKNPQTEIETAYTSSGQPVISARKGNLYLEASRMDGMMPNDVYLYLRSLEDIAASDANPDQAAMEYVEVLLTSLYKEMIEQYLDLRTEAEYSEDLMPYMYEVLASSVLMFEPVELQFLYQDASTYEPGELLLQATVHGFDGNTHITNADTFLFPIWYDENLTLHIPQVSEYSVSVSETDIHISMSNLYTPSFFAVVAIDRPKAEALYEAAVQLKRKQESVDCTENETDGSETDLPDETVFAYKQPGTPCTSASSFKKVSQGSRTFSSEYTFLRGTSKSVCTMWYDSSTVRKGYQESTDMEYLMPKSSDAKGEFGFRITNVGYSTSAQCNLDLYVTVTNFKSYSLDASGNRVNGVYPFINMNKKLAVYYQGGLPDFELQCDIVKSGTKEKIPGNYRFMWTDIDGAQRYGFLPLNGKLDARYCINTSTVNCGTETLFSSSYYLVYGQEETSTESNVNCSVMYETSSMSSFKIYVGQNGDGTAAYQYSKDTILDRYEDASDGVYNYTARAKLGWNGKAYGPTELPSPLTKYVGNDTEKWSDSNKLSSVTDEYWYSLEVFIPQETSEYYYSEYQIKDVLPDGVDYVGDFSVQKIETGDTVSSFSLSQTKDTITITAKSSSLESSAFYGFTYNIRFKVKMDPAETQPVYNKKEAVYKVENKAVQTGKHKSDSSLSTVSSNTVTTTASEKRPTVKAPVKWIQKSSGLVKEYDLNNRTDSFVYEIQQKIPVLKNAWRLDSVEIKDQLEDCLDLKEVSVYQDDTLCGRWTPTESGTVKKGWVCTISGQKIQVCTKSKISEEAYDSTVRVLIRSAINAEADLSGYTANKTEELCTFEIPNQASSTFTWENGTPATETQKSNLVTVRLKELVLTMSRIILTKSILAEEIVWAHGNPVFTFCVEGTDRLGTTHKYYDTVEFTRDQTNPSGTVTRQVTFEIPSGTYRAYETNVIRYHLSSIDGITNGTAAGVGVNFTVTAEKHGTATFHNRKTTDEKLSDTVFVRNVIVQ